MRSVGIVCVCVCVCVHARTRTYGFAYPVNIVVNDIHRITRNTFGMYIYSIELHVFYLFY